MTATVETPAFAAPVASEVTFRIRRFQPELDEEPHWEDYTVALYPTDRVLTALEKIKGEIDGTLTFRRSCGHGICGSDAMRVNGVNRLACKVLMRDLLPAPPRGRSAGSAPWHQTFLPIHPRSSMLCSTASAPSLRPCRTSRTPSSQHRGPSRPHGHVFR